MCTKSSKPLIHAHLIRIVLTVVAHTQSSLATALVLVLAPFLQLWHPECYPAPAVTNTTNGTGGVAIDVVDPHAGHGHRL